MGSVGTVEAFRQNMSESYPFDPSKGETALGNFDRNIPKMIELAKNAEQKAMVKFLEVAPRIGMGFWVHPEVPKDRLAALRKAFMAMLRDPAFLADAKKRKAPVNPVAGAKLDELVAEAYATPKATIAKLKTVFGFK